jgi:hypothetical protein
MWRLLLASVSVLLSAACGNPTAPDVRLTIEELHSKLDAVSAGGSVEFTLDQLTPDARTHYLASIGRADQSPEDYLGIPIRYEVRAPEQTRGPGVCVVAITTIEHRPGCSRPGYDSVKQSIVNRGRCPHDGYVPLPVGSRKTTTCRKYLCTYLRDVWVYYHQAE